MSAEPPTMARPRHLQSRCSLRRHCTVTSTSPAMSCIKLYWSPTTHKIEYDRRVTSARQGRGHSIDHTTTVAGYRLGHATPIYRALCMDVPGSPLEYKREGPGPFLGGRQKDEHTDRTTHSYAAWEQRLKQPAPPTPRPGASSLSHLACNPLLRALRCKKQKIDLSDWT